MNRPAVHDPRLLLSLLRIPLLRTPAQFLKVPEQLPQGLFVREIKQRCRKLLQGRSSIPTEYSLNDGSKFFLLSTKLREHRPFIQVRQTNSAAPGRP